MRLTDNQQDALNRLFNGPTRAAWPNWSAFYRLADLGLAERIGTDDTFRITEAGRDAVLNRKGPGRPRIHSNDAGKQAAYRQRKRERDQAELDALRRIRSAAVDALREALIEPTSDEEIPHLLRQLGAERRRFLDAHAIDRPANDLICNL